MLGSLHVSDKSQPGSHTSQAYHYLNTITRCGNSIINIEQIKNIDDVLKWTIKLEYAWDYIKKAPNTKEFDFIIKREVSPKHQRLKIMLLLVVAVLIH